MDFSFITDTGLRRRVENAIEYIFTVYEDSKENSDRGDLYLTETYRVIILYVASTIEAILFYIYAERGEYQKRIEYKEKYYLPEAYKSVKLSGRVVIAIEQEIERTESDIGLRGVANFLFIKKILRQDTVDRILAIHDLRNTFHFRKQSGAGCTIAEVEDALDLLVYVTQHAPKSLQRK